MKSAEGTEARGKPVSPSDAILCKEIALSM